ncbi:MAG: thiazole synthase [Candidatus Thermochlorobacter aerophilum]|jgi:thiazole synthase|uniref:Thiazole synthase n=1 Tax=Candidatus Thermochlorobacter aerophilus TaxID=1868324 RepID=A0A395M2H5_9BACT|nr:MAG: thiazole synthase [Candidatus Thermochlorobacter aerophilum]
MGELVIAGKAFQSRLLIGTAKYPNPQTMLAAIEASGAEIVTVSIRRINVQETASESIIKYLEEKNLFFLPNTAGCYTAKDAVLTAQLARESLNTNWIKLEVIGDDETLFPDTVELLKAAEQLLNDGFIVLAYTNDDPITCKKLYNLGCHAVMPLASPIGSGMGIRNPYNLQIIREQLPDIPLIIDAGIGTASDAAIAMELGYDGVLLNTAVSQAQHPVQMAEAMKLAVKAGRLAFEAGRIPRKLYATASSPLEGIIGQ